MIGNRQFWGNGVQYAEIFTGFDVRMDHKILMVTTAAAGKIPANIYGLVV